MLVTLRCLKLKIEFLIFLFEINKEELILKKKATNVVDEMQMQVIGIEK